MNPYPTVSNNTGSLSEAPAKALELARAYPAISGIALGLVGGYLFKHPLAGAVFGYFAGKLIQ